MPFQEMYLSPMCQLMLFLRILLAGFCGLFIGMERSRRQKEAGIRTHVVVAVGAAAAMVISKYGFMDIVIYNSIQLDASRIASNVMTGIGFLGAGRIFTKSGSVKGLTTAAGVWATAAVGLAMGAGLYVIGLLTTITILFIHVNKNFFSRFEGNATDTIEAVVDNDDEIIEAFMAHLDEHDVRVMSSEIHKQDDGTIKMILAVKLNRGIDLNEAMSILRKSDKVKSFIT